MRVLLVLLLLLPALASAQDAEWKVRYRRADVVQQVGARTFQASTLAAAAGLAFFAPNHWDKGTRWTNRIGSGLVYGAATGFVAGPAVMLGGALWGRGALRDAPLFELTGPGGVYGAGRGGRIGVVAWLAAASTVPIALATRDRFVWIGLAPLVLSWYAAATLVSNNRTAWDELTGDDSASLGLRISIATITLPL